MAAIAKGLVKAGERRLVVAGGATSGAVVKAPYVQGLAIGPSAASVSRSSRALPESSECRRLS